MGRKIPGKKHRGVKDPLEQIEKRNKSLATKVNAPPSCPDEQDIPKSLLHLMKLKQSVKEGKFRRLKKKKKKKGKPWLINTEALNEKDVPLPGMTRPDKPAPVFVQTPGESNYHFLHRIEQACQEVMKETAFEDKYGVNVIRNPETGSVVGISKKEKENLSDLEISNKGHAKSKSTPTVVLTKSAKRKQKKLAKLQTDEENIKEFDQYKDEVKFGEVVSRPPSLKPSRLIAKKRTLESKPGKKDLLLKSLMNNKSEVKKPNPSPSLQVKKLKLKHIPEGKRRQLENERLQAVEAYRNLKAMKNKPFSE